MLRKISILNKHRKFPGRLCGKGLYIEGDGQTGQKEREDLSASPTHLRASCPMVLEGPLLAVCTLMKARLGLSQPQEVDSALLAVLSSSAAYPVALATTPLSCSRAVLPAVCQSVAPPTEGSRVPGRPCPAILAGAAACLSSSSSLSQT